jgi:hypothetical protein
MVKGVLPGGRLGEGDGGIGVIGIGRGSGGLFVGFVWVGKGVLLDLSDQAGEVG